MNIKEYKKLCILETYNKKFYVFESDKLNILDDLIEKQKFIMISGQRINTSNIADYGEIPSSPIYDFIISMPEITRYQGLKIMKEFENSKHSEGVLTLHIFIRRLRAHFRIPSGLGGFDTYEQFVVHFLHKNYPNA